MQTVVGLDFGTTNSILSYYDETKQIVESFKLGGVDGSNYIPSYLAISKDDIKEKYIGKEAKSEDRENYYIFSHFKMLFAEDNKGKLSKYGYSDYTPKEIAKNYIKMLLDRYKEESKNSIKDIVVTVPEIWLIDNNKSREILVKIIEELGLPLKELISEPVAGGGYFLHKYEEINDEQFSGNFIIFDYGGGTLDISLLRLENNDLEVLERTGNGNSIESLGNAGTAYDEAVIQYIYRQNNKKIDTNSQQYTELLIEFEKQKIEKKEKIKIAVSRYIKNNKVDKKIFAIDGVDITPSILVKVFEPFKENIKAKLRNIETYFDMHNIDEEDRKRLKIIMVGGFSNFYLSQMAVKEFFNSKTDDDPRFNHHLNLEDTALAISKGATLFAKELVKLKKTYPISIALIYSFIDHNAKLEEAEWMFIKRGEEINYEVTYYDKFFANLGEITLHFYMGSVDFKVTPLNKNNISSKIEKCKIGFSIDRNSIIKMHISDKNDVNIKTITLGDLINEYKNKLIAEA